QFVMVCIGLFYTLLESNRQKKNEYNLITYGLSSIFIALILDILAQPSLSDEPILASPLTRVLGASMTTAGLLILSYALVVSRLSDKKSFITITKAFWAILGSSFVILFSISLLSHDTGIQLVWIPGQSDSALSSFPGEWIFAFQQIFILIYALATLITQVKERTLYSQGFLLFMAIGRIGFIGYLVGLSLDAFPTVFPRVLAGLSDPLGFLLLVMAINQIIAEDLQRLNLQLMRRTKLLEEATKSLTKLNQISTNLLKTTQIPDIGQAILKGLSDEFGFVHTFLLLLDRTSKMLHGIKLDQHGQVVNFMELDIRQDHFLVDALLKGKPLFYGDGSRMPDKDFIKNYSFTKNIVTVPLLTKKETTCFNMHGCDKVNCPIQAFGMNACWLARDECEFYDPEEAAEIGPCIDCKAFNVVGLLVVDNRSSRNKVNEENLAFLETFANQAGMALHNASLVEDLSREVTFRERTFKSLPNGVMVLDEKGMIKSLNPSLLHILGMTNEDVTDIPYEAVRLVNDEDRFHHIVNIVLTEGVGYEGIGESWTLTLPGRTLKLNIKVNPLPGTGVRYGAVILFEDITEVSQLQQQLVQSEKLATVGQMAAGIAHEVNNPLAGVSGFLQVMASRLPEDSPERHAMQAALKDINRASGTIKDLLKFARLGPAQKKDSDIHEILNESMMFIQFQKEYKGISINRRFNEQLPSVVCDPDQMRQVFTNLVLNGLQAMGETGELTVTTAAQNGTVRVFVEDTGSGIPFEKYGSIFEPWFTTKQAKGTGLGLTNCDKIVNDHGGTLAFSSKEGEGTTFVIDIPLEYATKGNGRA
ncbi:MAG TPA: ATP-binding protein, partial [bacterium]